MNLSSGGLAIVAIAAIWFLVFLPSFIKGDSLKTKVVEAPVAMQPKLDDRTRQVLKFRRNRATFALVTTGAFVVSGFSALEFATSGQGLFVLVASLLVTAVGGFATVKANTNYREQLAGSVRRSVPLVSSKPTPRRDLTEVLDNSWTPSELPKQSFLQTGAIEVVDLAEVVEIPKQEIDNIDEILRRRRSIG